MILLKCCVVKMQNNKRIVCESCVMITSTCKSARCITGSILNPLFKFPIFFPFKFVLNLYLTLARVKQIRMNNFRSFKNTIPGTFLKEINLVNANIVLQNKS